VTLPKPNLHIFVILLAREQLALMKSPGKYSNSEAGQQEKFTIQTNSAVFFVSRLLVTFVGKNEKFLEEIVGHQGECAILENIFWGRRSFWSKRDFSEM